MCRLLALRSAEPFDARRPLWSAPHALARQSVAHPDGWGIAHLERGALRIERAVAPAHGCALYRRHSADIASPLVLAHIRRASVGGNRMENTHPFTHDGWVFAHNGTVRRFDERRKEFERRIAPELRRHIQGDTDSERCFFMFLTELRREKRGDPLERAARALARVAAFTRETDPHNLPRPSAANFVATDGNQLLAIRYGRSLSFAALGAEPGPLRNGASVETLLIASEPTDPALPWRKISHGQGLAIDGRLQVRRFSTAASS